MGKRAVAILALGAALWSGAWVYGKGAIRDGVDDQIAAMRMQGIEASYSAIEIGGFPFGYEGRMIEPRYAMDAPMERENGQIETVTVGWKAPWMEIDASIADLKGLDFTVANTQTLTLAPIDGGAPVEVSIRSTDLRGRLALVDSRALLKGNAASLTIEIVPPPSIDGEPLTVSLTGIDFSGEGPEVVDGVASAPEFVLSGKAKELRLRSRISEVPHVYAQASDIQLAARIAQSRLEADIAATESSFALAGPLDLATRTGAILGKVSGPAMALERPQRLALTLDVADADPGTAIWSMLDPSGTFPREVARLQLDAEAMAILTVPLTNLAALIAKPPVLHNATVKSLIVEAAGIELDADGSGTVVDGMPEGTATLRISGVDGFMDDAVAAGLIPEQQASVYRMMLENFGRKGEAPEQKKFNVTMRGGMTFVNGLPIGPAPSLPQ